MRLFFLFKMLSTVTSLLNPENKSFYFLRRDAISGVAVVCLLFLRALSHLTSWAISVNLVKIRLTRMPVPMISPLVEDTREVSDFDWPVLSLAPWAYNRPIYSVLTPKELKLGRFTSLGVLGISGCLGLISSKAVLIGCTAASVRRLTSWIWSFEKSLTLPSYVNISLMSLFHVP